MAMQFAQARRAQMPSMTDAMAQQAQIANELRGAENEAKMQMKGDLMGAGATAAGSAAAAIPAGTTGAAALGAMGPIGWAGLAALALGALS